MRVLYLLYFLFTALVALNKVTPGQDKIISAYQKSKCNMFFAGMNNQIEIVSTDTSLSRLSVKFYSSEVKGDSQKGLGNLYSVRISGNGFCRIDIYDGKKILNSQVYKCLSHPIIYVRLTNGLLGGNIQLEKLQAQTGLRVALETCECDSSFKIENYKMIYKSEGIHLI